MELINNLTAPKNSRSDRLTMIPMKTSPHLRGSIQSIKNDVIMIVDLLFSARIGALDFRWEVTRNLTIVYIQYTHTYSANLGYMNILECLTVKQHDSLNVAG